MNNEKQGIDKELLMGNEQRAAICSQCKSKERCDINIHTEQTQRQG